MRLLWVSQFSRNLHKPITYLYLKIKTYPIYNEEIPVKVQLQKEPPCGGEEEYLHRDAASPESEPVKYGHESYGTRT
jgi:hypothetical protein